MKKNKLVLFLLFLLFLLFFAFSNLTLLAQKIEVKGKVVIFNIVPVVNANVKMPGSETSVKTDQDGSFTCICNEKDKLVITAAGFQKLVIKVKKKKAKQLVARMRLKKSSEASKMAIEKGHILQVSEFEELLKKRSDIKDYSKYTSVLHLIQNEFPSLQIEKGEVVIRGVSSVQNSTAARFVLDGVMIESTAIPNIPTFQIASVKVVKDGKAAFYGIRGGTGIILIKTKSGNSN
ncbi:carboxypeptidase-like regulatory domain-containing protein [Ancylomarina sp. YFZ004]